MIELVKPFPTAALPELWRWVQAFRGRIADDFFPDDLDAFVDHWIACEDSGRLSWGVLRDGELGGVVTSIAGMTPICRDFHCVFRKDFWGEQTVVPALTLACEELFAIPNILKLQSVAFADNRSLKGSMRAFGVEVEGRLEKHTLRGGQLVDLVVLGLTKETFLNVLRSRNARSEPDHEPRRGGEELLQQSDEHHSGPAGDGILEHDQQRAADGNDAADRGPGEGSTSGAAAGGSASV